MNWNLKQWNINISLKSNLKADISKKIYYTSIEPQISKNELKKPNSV